MASTKHWVPKAKRHCRVFINKSVTNALGQTQANYVKRRPATVVGFATDTNPTLRVGHHSETYGTGSVGIVRQIDSTVPVGGDAAGETRLPGAAVRVVTGVGKYISQ